MLTVWKVPTTLRAISRWLPVGLWAAIIFFLSDQPSLPKLGPSWISFAAHFGEYLVLAFLLARANDARTGIVGAGVYGITDEFHQAFVPGRTPDVADWLADIAGALVGVFLYRLARRVPVLR